MNAERAEIQQTEDEKVLLNIFTSECFSGLFTINKASNLRFG